MFFELCTLKEVFKQLRRYDLGNGISLCCLSQLYIKWFSKHTRLYSDVTYISYI